MPEGKLLLKKNKLEINRSAKNTTTEGLEASLRQQPNRRFAGIPFRLIANQSNFWFLDSTHVAQKRKEKNVQLRNKNNERLAKQKRINDKRIQKAIQRGDATYREKIITLKDTLNPKRFFGEWLKYKYGEAPVFVDTSNYRRSTDQLEIYMRKRGYFNSKVTSFIDTSRNGKKAKLNFAVESGNPMIIDSIFLIGSNENIKATYLRYMRKADYKPLIGEFFDSDILQNHRNAAANFMRDECFYGFTAANINFRADTLKKPGRVLLGIEFSDRPIKVAASKDSVTFVRHQVTQIRTVYFHLIDTTFFDKAPSFAAFCQERNLNIYDENNYLQTFDTLYFDDIYFDRKEKINRHIPEEKDSLNPLRQAIFLYNGVPSVDPAILEQQNFLEQTNYYKEYYLERTYSRLVQLDLFQTIKPVLVEIPGTNKLDVHYYLIPAKKHVFRFEPRATNSNGLLGVSASFNYTNKNLSKNSTRLVVGFSGGFESQPPVFQEDITGNSQSSGRTFNTFEIGPTAKLELPGIFPFSFVKLKKRENPRTIFSIAYNYQRREDFSRSSFQLNYLFQLNSGKTQVVKGMILLPPVIKFVSLDNFSPFFQQQLQTNNDLFFRNAYSDQFIWQDFKFVLEFNNKQIRTGKTTVAFNTSIDNAGLLLNYISKKDTSVTGQRMVFGVPYSNFVRLDNELVLGRALGKRTSLHFRALAGMGIPYLNTKTSLPYDYSFFGGGTNDNRGWQARTLGPGGYQVYYDSVPTFTQIGDIRLGAFGEFRFGISKRLRGAVFLDASNIWTYNDDPERPGAQFSKTWYKEIGLTSGFGIRMDFEYFIVRADFGIPLTNPALPEGSRWIFQSKDAYYQQAEAVYGSNFMSRIPSNPFVIQPHFGIGYPF